MKLHPKDLAIFLRMRREGGTLGRWQYGLVRRPDGGREHLYWSPGGNTVKVVTDVRGASVVTIDKATGERVTLDSSRGVGFELRTVLHLLGVLLVIAPASVRLRLDLLDVAGPS